MLEVPLAPRYAAVQQLLTWAGWLTGPTAQLLTQASPGRSQGVQPGPDAGQYLKGAVWTMQMYIQGRCPDYRYTYTGASPAPAELLQVSCTRWPATPPSCTASLAARALQCDCTGHHAACGCLRKTLRSNVSQMTMVTLHLPLIQLCCGTMRGPSRRRLSAPQHPNMHVA
jgi:hypothetical protein